MKGQEKDKRANGDSIGLTPSVEPTPSVGLTTPVPATPFDIAHTTAETAKDILNTQEILKQESLSEQDKDLVVKLRNKYWYNQNDLSPNERGFLAKNIDSLKIETRDREMFMRLKSEHDLAPKKISYEKKSINFKDEILHSKINSLFEKAEQTLQRFLRLAASGYVMPEKEYNPQKTGGFVTISFGTKGSKDPRKVQLRKIGGGSILAEEDKDYGTRGEKYKFFSRWKDLMSVLEWNRDSGDSSFGVKGRIGFDYEDKNIGISYSGGTELQDQAISVIAAREAEMIDDLEVDRRQKKSNNPYLTPEFLEALENI